MSAEVAIIGEAGQGSDVQQDAGAAPVEDTMGLRHFTPTVDGGLGGYWFDCMSLLEGMGRLGRWPGAVKPDGVERKPGRDRGDGIG
ncbi:hypothetical protein MishRS11D_35070 [Methylomagnum ishizawai]|nr:hypothetical protein MishRS11D_35070 [Methylomagnum ishizawai]